MKIGVRNKQPKCCGNTW